MELEPLHIMPGDLTTDEPEVISEGKEVMAELSIDNCWHPATVTALLGMFVVLSFYAHT